jgi:hypothetical protein
MTPEQMVYLILAVAGAVGTAYWRISSVMTEIRSDLAAHKLHVAETYITKAGLRETTEQIISAVHGVKTDVHSLNERIDRIIEHQQLPPRSARRGS